VIGKMLTVELDQRYQSAQEVETALVTLITPEPGAITSFRATPKSRLKLAAKIAVVIIAVPVAISALGFLETAAFNYALGRTSPFDEEQRLAWLGAGASALFLPLIYQVGLFFVLAAARFIVRLLSLSRNIDRLLATGLTHTQQLSSRLRLNDPVV